MQAAANETSVDLTVPNTITLTRVFAAPRELVWRALTEPEMLTEWYGPNGFRCEVESLDLRPGGEWKFTWHGPNDMCMPGHIVFREVEPPTRLVSDQYVPQPGGATATMRRVITLDEVEGGTRLTLRMQFESVEAREAALQRGGTEGGKQILGRLAEFLEKAQAEGENV